MFLRLFLFAIAFLLVSSFAYYLITRVTFKDERGSVSRFYCRWIGQEYQLTKPVIFIPGIKGSLLSQNGRTRWIRLWQVLIPTKPFLVEANESPVTPVGIFTRLVVIPGLIEYTPYQKISAYLACSPNAYFFSYDWRQNPLDHLPSLHRLVERVQRETGQKPSIIAHSMGGLITHSYIKTVPNTVDKVVYVGVPFLPGVGYINDLEEGARVGFNQRS